MKNAHKKSVEPFAFIGYSEVLDYLFIPITTYKPTPISGSAVAKIWDETTEKCPSFQNNQISYFAFFYSMMCILNYALCFIGNYIR